MTNAESKAAAILGRKGGSSKSEAKQAAARANGRKGGKPKKIAASSGIQWLKYGLHPKIES